MIKQLLRIYFTILLSMLKQFFKWPGFRKLTFHFSLKSEFFCNQISTHLFPSQVSPSNYSHWQTSVPLVKWCSLVVMWGLKKEPASMWLWSRQIYTENEMQSSWAALSASNPFPQFEHLHQLLPSHPIFCQTLEESGGWSLWVSILDLLQLP